MANKKPKIKNKQNKGTAVENDKVKGRGKNQETVSGNQKIREVKGSLRHLRVSPRKIRLMARVVKGMPVEEAKAQLITSPKRSSVHILKLLESVMANAENNFNMNSKNLFIKKIRVDKAPTLKRWMPRARGAVGMIKKEGSHVLLVLGENETQYGSRFIIPSKEVKEQAKKEKSKKKKGQEKKKTGSREEEKDKSKSRPLEPKVEQKPKSKKQGGLKKFFRRKSM